ncbi:MAG: VOC family protein [Inquilinus sp.]|nr:VOC family protein [Inquilinus sp.]
MDQRITMVTLGVADMARARRFYCEGLGWRESAAGNESVAFIEAGGVVLGLYGRAGLAEDAGVPDDGNGFRGVALAHNVASEADVDRVLEEAVAAGATLVKPGEKVFWGGYSGYFADPDGHLWEVARNPFSPLDADGRMTLPPPKD